MQSPKCRQTRTSAAAIFAASLAVALLAACDENPTTGAVCDPEVEDCSGVADTGSGEVGADAGSDAVGADARADADSRDTGTDSGRPDVNIGPDEDGDGISDEVEGDGDFDGDGIPNYLDEDSDDDGILDRDETAADDDFDGYPNFIDTDSDGDGFLDGDEGLDDPDGDGLPNFRDSDSDGDGLDDGFEGFDDPDGDGIPNLYDIDSDGDNIRDKFELSHDPDEDGIPAFLYLDSDNDGWSDSEEYGRVPGSDLPPLDSDGDRIFDFLDLDSDGDGLGDDVELGCPESTERTLQDSDDDGYTDLLEVAFGADEDDVGQACDPTVDITDDVDFFFKLNYLVNVENDILDFVVDVRRADVAFNMDTTGSMGGEISELQGSLTSVIIPTLSREIADSAYSFAQFDDFPCDGYGGGEDRPFILRQRVTTSVAAATTGVMSLARHAGGDYFESGFESIYQTCTGFGRDSPACIPGPEVPAFDPAVGYVPGVADGEIGGVGFREGALPIIVHMTDAPSHAKGDSGDYPYGASRNETFAAMRSIGARLIGVASGEAARTDLEQMAIRAGSTVPACAWTDPIEGTRPLGCAETMCCTAGSGSGVPPVDGQCPLVYDIAGSGLGLDTSVVAGIRALINFAEFDLTTRVRDDDTDPRADTSEFIVGVVPVRAEAPDTGCAEEPEIADLNRDGVDDHFLGVVPGSRLTFDITAYNGVVPETNAPQVFTAFIDVVQQGGAVLDTQIVTILVPPSLKPTD